MYITTDELSARFLGRYTFGTNGTDLATVGQGTGVIYSAAKFIDYTLSDIYGTGNPMLFGTNNLGTAPVDEVIKMVCADLSVAWALTNARLTITETTGAWVKEIETRGMSLLEQIHELKVKLPNFKGTITGNLPNTTEAEGEVWGEIINTTGTGLVALQYPWILKNSVTVYGTKEVSPAVYQEGLDYEMFFYGQGTTGTNYGYIRVHGTGTLTNPATVRIDYKYKKFPIFDLDDFQKWGETSREVRG